VRGGPRERGGGGGGGGRAGRRGVLGPPALFPRRRGALSGSPPAWPRPRPGRRGPPRAARAGAPETARRAAARDRSRRAPSRDPIPRVARVVVIAADDLDLRRRQEYHYSIGEPVAR